MPLPLKIRETEKGASGYRPGFSTSKSWRGRVFTQDTTIHYVIELNEPSPSLYVTPLPGVWLERYTRANAQARVCVVWRCMPARGGLGFRGGLRLEWRFGSRRVGSHLPGAKKNLRDKTFIHEDKFCVFDKY